MINFDKATKNIGNRFDLVLVASERAREISTERREREDYAIGTKQKLEPVYHIALTEIEEGKVGREYLDKIKERDNQKRRKPKFE